MTGETSRYIKRVASLLLLALSLAFPAAAQDIGSTPPLELPLLEAGLHIGSTFYGSGRVLEDAALLDRITDAVAQGMSAFTFYEDWRELEPEAGRYQLDDLEATLIWLEGLGITPLLNITLVDIDSLEGMPSDLLDAGGTTLAGGMVFDDPSIIARFNALLDQVVPLLVERKGFLLLLGNEVDRYFQEVNPDALSGYAQLIQAGGEHIHSIAPELAVGVTLTGGEVLQQERVFQTLRPVTDIIPFNYYPLNDEFRVLPLEDIPAILESYMQIYGSSPVIIQELGCPSGEALGSSPDYQRECFEIMFETLRTYPQVRYVSVFTLYDWDEATCDLLMNSFGYADAGLPDIYLTRLRGYLCTLGLLNADYSPKPAWETFLTIIRSIGQT